MLIVDNHVNAMCVYGNVYGCMHGRKLILPMQRLTPEIMKMPLSDETWYILIPDTAVLITSHPRLTFWVCVHVDLHSKECLKIRTCCFASFCSCSLMSNNFIWTWHTLQKLMSLQLSIFKSDSEYLGSQNLSSGEYFKEKICPYNTSPRSLTWWLWYHWIACVKTSMALSISSSWLYMVTKADTCPAKEKLMNKILHSLSEHSF